MLGLAIKLAAERTGVAGVLGGKTKGSLTLLPRLRAQSKTGYGAQKGGRKKLTHGG